MLVFARFCRSWRAVAADELFDEGRRGRLAEMLFV
jgi:hypothetical protein